MSVGWVACSVRARAIDSRRLGRRGARELAGSASLDDALNQLVQSPYGHAVRLGQSLAQAQRAVTDTAVWHVRVLAGWAPRTGVAMIRALAGAAEIVNVLDLIRQFSGAEPSHPPYDLGGLSTAWPRLARATSPAELRRVLGTSPWGDPGAESGRSIGLTMRAVLADWVLASVPLATPLAIDWTALLVAREVAFGRTMPPRARVVVSRVLGSAAAGAGTLPELIRALPRPTRAFLTDVRGPDDLWRAEGRWWRRVDEKGAELARQVAAGPEVLVGATARLAADAWRVRAALELAARGGAPLAVFDAVA